MPEKLDNTITLWYNISWLGENKNSQSTSPKHNIC
jgi:hypothetical protein